MSLDETLYSRQLYVLGREAMEAMARSKVLVAGVSGVGLEILKCIVLAGVKSITIFDENEITQSDWVSNYYATEQDIGKNRVDVIIDKLRELNPYVSINGVDKDMESIIDIISNYDVIVISGDYKLSEATFINNYCRMNYKKFIYAKTYGLFGFVFCDFGELFPILDIDGESPKEGMIMQISQGVYICNDPHELLRGDKIKITDNTGSRIETITKIINKTSFITDNPQTDSVLQNTFYCQIKETTEMKFVDLKTSINNPTFSTVISSDFERQNKLHKFNIILNEYISKYGNLPKEWDENDFNKLKSITDVDNLEPEQIELFEKLSYTCSGNLCPFDAVFGSIAGQEVIKACSNKFIPINQWFYYDAINTLPDDISQIKLANTNRYAYTKYIGMEKIYGNEIVNKIKNSNIFIVGAGAIGCEHLKNFAKMGIKNIHITDMDTIEKSNLNRQFLFRNSDIGKFKSEAGAEAIKKINPDVNVIPYKLKVEKESLSVFSNKFLSGLTAITTALDNVGARLFVDQLCIDNKIPMIDSGTLGAKGNTQIVIPNVTETYGTTKDPTNEKQIPVCTLKNFPYLIEHTIQWARDQFDGLFVKAPQNYNKYMTEYIENTNKLSKMASSELDEFVKQVNFVNDNYAKKRSDCVKFGLKLYNKIFREQIENLIKEHPEDEKVDGILFWSGTKKFPKVLKYTNDNIDLDFVYTTANLWADVCGIKRMKYQKMKKYIENLNTQKIVFKQETKYENIEEMIYDLPINKNINKLNILEFEKDSEINYHIEFITYTSNLRANNYNIQNADKLKTKQIVGRIIPAIATTTSLVSGLVSLELIKIIQQFDKIEKYECAFANLTQSMFSFSEPSIAKTKRIGKYQHSVWSNEKLEGDMKLKEIINYVSKLIDDKNYGITMITLNDSENIWTEAFNDKLKEEREDTKILKLYSKIMKTDLENIPNPINIQFHITNELDFDEEISPIIINLFY